MKRLDGAELRAMLSRCALAREIILLAETGSTNDEAMRMGRDGAADGTVIFAENQTSGRGRFGRKWDAEPGAALTFSVLLRPQMPMRDWPRLTTCAAVAVAEAIEEMIDGRAAIKWPNDVYLAEKKVAGILIESHADKFAVVGIGVNVNQKTFAEPLSESAISMRQMVRRELDRAEVAAAILRRLDALLATLRDDFPKIVAAAEARSYLRGRWIEAEIAGRRECGIAETLDEDGALILRKSDGTALVLSSGEVSRARAAF